MVMNVRVVRVKMAAFVLTRRTDSLVDADGGSAAKTVKNVEVRGR